MQSTLTAAAVASPGSDMSSSEESLMSSTSTASNIPLSFFYSDANGVVLLSLVVAGRGGRWAGGIGGGGGGACVPHGSLLALDVVGDKVGPEARCAGGRGVAAAAAGREGLVASQQHCGRSLSLVDMDIEGVGAVGGAEQGRRGGACVVVVMVVEVEGVLGPAGR
ncbi:hypothetical protein U9M48_011266 [Paspalum notatum var. saurae]|uniref:Uncharacterized protein n=1 Tax=Paspalum notatum var. saurae TaxID=547442 RepID=A0AAQ3SVD5_PASNO